MKIDVKGLMLPKSGRRQGDMGDDRVAILRGKSVGVALLADGATGWGYGGTAAAALLNHVMQEVKRADPMSEDACIEILEEADTVVNKATGGEGDTTAILFVTDGRKVWGASAGDSVCTRFSKTVEDLTWQQVRRPRLGGGCQPVGFSSPVTSGDTFLLASDGVTNFIYKPELITEAVTSATNSQAVTEALVALVRQSNNGQLPDDVSMVSVRF